MAFVDSNLNETKQTSSEKQVDSQPRKSMFGRSRKKLTQTQWARAIQLGQRPDFSAVDLPTRMKLLRQFGNFSIAYSTAVQPLLRHFGGESGYIAYRRRIGVTLALGDPVVSRDNLEDLVTQFVTEHKRPVFCQISLPVAKVLSGLGYYINEFGVDTSLDLNEYSLAGKQKEWLRYASNWVNRRGFQVLEADVDKVDVERVEAISEAWRMTRTVKRKEVRFLNRPIVLDPEPDVRRFFLFDSDNQIQAYVFMDPLYQSGQVAGYVTAFKRRHPDAPQYAEQAIMKTIIEKMKSEGVPKIMLGLSPCAWLEDENEFAHSKFTSWIFQLMFDSKFINSWAYHLVGHARYKRRFRGTEEKVYFASPSKFSFRQLASLVGLCGIA